MSHAERRDVRVAEGEVPCSHGRWASVTDALKPLRSPYGIVWVCVNKVRSPSPHVYSAAGALPLLTRALMGTIHDGHSRNGNRSKRERTSFFLRSTTAAWAALSNAPGKG